MGQRRKWKRLPDKRPGEIIRAALEVFSAKGYRAATMEEVAVAAGVTKGTIYLYFPSKRDLFIAMIRAQLQEVMDLLPAINYELGQDPEALTRTVGLAFLEVLMAGKVTKALPLVLGEFNHVPTLKELYFGEVLSKADLRVAELIRQGKDLGLVRDVDPDVAARCLLGAFFVIVLTQEVLKAKEITPMRPEDIVDTIATIYFRGLLKTETSS